MKRIFPRSFYNPITLIGGALAALSFALTLALIILDFVEGEQKPYMGIITFVMMPTFMFIGLAIGGFGILREHRRERLGLSLEHRMPTLDLNDPHQRTAFTWVSIGAIVLLVLSAFGSYKAYDYTDSDTFCGEMCHKVMHPEYTAYQQSPHARVGCVKCHIGSGAGWYVRSKLSGAYQIYSVLFNKYSRPIATPIENLRPAQETCEQCHWPRHFYSQKRLMTTYFLSDEQNTRWTLDMLVKVGGGSEESGNSEGIHWHMNIANKVTYATPDHRRQVIPWVKVESRDGRYMRVYHTTDNPPAEKELAGMEHRVMDCIDCHNRPSHIYRPPQQPVDHAMSASLIDATLPYAKAVSVQVLDRPYTTDEVALDSIRQSIDAYYQKNYPSLASSRAADIERMVAEVQRIYSHNFFATMNVSWRKFPNNIGHMFSAGCFRCHDGKHVSDDGKVLSKDCNVCHTILAQEYEGKDRRVSLDGLPYEHPVDIGDAWKEMNCSDCHTSP